MNIKKIFSSKPHCNIYKYSDIIDSEYTTALDKVKPMIDSYAKSKDCFISIQPDVKNTLRISADFKKGKEGNVEFLDISTIDKKTPFVSAVFEVVDRVAEQTGKYVKPIQMFIDETIENLHRIGKI